MEQDAGKDEKTDSMGSEGRMAEPSQGQGQEPQELLAALARGRSLSRLQGAPGGAPVQKEFAAPDEEKHRALHIWKFTGMALASHSPRDWVSSSLATFASPTEHRRDALSLLREGTQVCEAGG